MKKIINNPADVVKEALQGMKAAYEGTLDQMCIRDSSRDFPVQ